MKTSSRFSQSDVKSTCTQKPSIYLQGFLILVTYFATNAICHLERVRQGTDVVLGIAAWYQHIAGDDKSTAIAPSLPTQSVIITLLGGRQLRREVGPRDKSPDLPSSSSPSEDKTMEECCMQYAVSIRTERPRTCVAFKLHSVFARLTEMDFLVTFVFEIFRCGLKFKFPLCILITIRANYPDFT